MRRMILNLAMIMFFLCSLTMASASETLLFQGRWGKEVNQLGISFPSPGVMPVAPYMCIGSYDVDETGGFWFSDSINNMLKCYKNKTWSYILVNFGKMGDLVCHGKKIFVVTREPDGVAVINPENGKVERQLRISFKNPGRLKVFADNLVAVEDSGAGVWISKDDKPYLHPAVALEAAGNINRIYGVQYNAAEDSRTIISAELADEIQEPEVLAVYEPEDKIIFCKTAGMKDEKPVLMVVTNSQPEVLKFVTITKEQAVTRVELKMLDGPFLTTSWKLCSDGNIYGFAGDAEKGFKVYKAEKSL